MGRGGVVSHDSSTEGDVNGSTKENAEIEHGSKACAGAWQPAQPGADDRHPEKRNTQAPGAAAADTFPRRQDPGAEGETEIAMPKFKRIWGKPNLWTQWHPLSWQLSATVEIDCYDGIEFFAHLSIGPIGVSFKWRPVYWGPLVAVPKLGAAVMTERE